MEMDSAALPPPINNRRSGAKRSFLLYDEDDAKSRTRLVSDVKGAGHLLFLLHSSGGSSAKVEGQTERRERNPLLNLPQRQSETSASTPTALMKKSSDKTLPPTIQSIEQRDDGRRVAEETPCRENSAPE